MKIQGNKKNVLTIHNDIIGIYIMI